jgi:adenylate cyclase
MLTMSPSAKAAIYGLSVGTFGLMISLTLLGASLEENLGLHVLFRLRGARIAPKEVVIITLDENSARRLNVPGIPRKWPRSLHARLVSTLAEKNPAVIAFDLIFAEAHLPDHDDLLAKAISNAGNVVLAQWFQSEKMPVYERAKAKTGYLYIEKTFPPLSRFEICALGSAPFVLPKVPVKLNSYCAFMPSVEDEPSLPVLVFQIYALNAYDEMIELLREFSPSVIPKIPANKDTVISEKNVKNLVRILRNQFQKNSVEANKILNSLPCRMPAADNSGKICVLRSLIRTYQGPERRYLNFYGPPGTILTIPYYQVLEGLKNHGMFRYNLDFKDKVIFIGHSEPMRLEQKEGFHTVFSQADGLDISGVEIAATAFSNILEDMHVTPLSPAGHLLILGFWGLFIGSLCMAMPAAAGAGSVAGFSILYIWIIHYLFRQHALWLPLVIPIFLQVPVAFFGGVLWKYFIANKERKNIRTAFGYHLPDEVVDQLAKNLKNIKSGARLVHGTCLVTDAEQYTALSEKMNPENLNTFMNRYFEVVFNPVRRNSGIISDIKGDSVLAIWAAAYPDSELRYLACSAALEIIYAVNEFNRRSDPLQLPTRIGIHSGLMSLGHIGAIDHFEYRAAGDIVNTASRMEGLNKYLGTTALVSADVIDELEEFLFRNLGEFVFAGKSKPIEVFELICRVEEAGPFQLDLCNVFSKGFDAYRNRDWKSAIDLFNHAMQLEGGKGPSRFYLELCKNYWKNPPDPNWDGAVYLSSK